MKAELEQYQVEPKAFWAAAQMMGMDGYDTMEVAEARKWHAVPVWGSRGWDLGSWPLVVIYHRDEPNKYSVAEYCEGDITVYDCPTKELREAITNEIAFFHWHFQEESWVKGYNCVDELPDELKGPYRNR